MAGLPWTGPMSWNEACMIGYPNEPWWVPGPSPYPAPSIPTYPTQVFITPTTFPLVPETKNALIDQALALLELISGKEEQNAKLLEVAANLLKLARQADK